MAVVRMLLQQAAQLLTNHRAQFRERGKQLQFFGLDILIFGVDAPPAHHDAGDREERMHGSTAVRGDDSGELRASIKRRILIGAQALLSRCPRRCQLRFVVALRLFAREDAVCGGTQLSAQLRVFR